MAIHRSRALVSLYARDQLLLSGQLLDQFNAYLDAYPLHTLRQTQLDFKEWHSVRVTPAHLYDREIPQIQHTLNREPMTRFALDVYLEFCRKHQIALGAQIQAGLFSGHYRHHCYRITANHFPYYTHPDIWHGVVWLNPHKQFSDTEVAWIRSHLTAQFAAQGRLAYLFENQPHQRSVPELRHFQLFLLP